METNLSTENHNSHEKQLLTSNDVENRMRIIANLIIDKYLDDKKNKLLKTLNEPTTLKI